MIQIIGALMIMAAPPPADTVTGCLSKGQMADTYTLTSKDGKTYSVTSKSVKLGGHVGHMVTLTGDTKDMAMTATKLAMKAPSCS